MTRIDYVRSVIFGDAARPADLTHLGKQTGIPLSTLYRYRKFPMTIPLDALLVICEAQGMQPETFGRLLEGGN